MCVFGFVCFKFPWKHPNTSSSVHIIRVCLEAPVSNLILHPCLNCKTRSEPEPNIFCHPYFSGRTGLILGSRIMWPMYVPDGHRLWYGPSTLQCTSRYFYYYYYYYYFYNDYDYDYHYHYPYHYDYHYRYHYHYHYDYDYD